eukprot:scaffold6847_cov101-Skeletonema_dohrnii-CCMP3373.AAC.4
MSVETSAIRPLRQADTYARHDKGTTINNGPTSAGVCCSVALRGGVMTSKESYSLHMQIKS